MRGGKGAITLTILTMNIYTELNRFMTVSQIRFGRLKTRLSKYHSGLRNSFLMLNNLKEECESSNRVQVNLHFGCFDWARHQASAFVSLSIDK